MSGRRAKGIKILLRVEQECHNRDRRIKNTTWTNSTKNPRGVPVGKKSRSICGGGCDAPAEVVVVTVVMLQLPCCCGGVVLVLPPCYHCR